MFFDLKIYEKSFQLAGRIWRSSVLYQLCTKGITIAFLSLSTWVLYAWWGTSGTNNYELLWRIIDWKSLVILPLFGLVFLLIFLFEHVGLLILSVAGYKGQRPSLFRVWQESLQCMGAILKIALVKGFFGGLLLGLGATLFWWIQQWVYDPLWLAFSWGLILFVGICLLFRVYIQWLFTSYVVCVEKIFDVVAVLKSPRDMMSSVLRRLAGHVILFYGVLFLLYLGLTALIFLILQGVIWLGLALLSVSFFVGFLGVFLLVGLFLIPLVLPILYHSFHTALYFRLIQPTRMVSVRKSRPKPAFSLRWIWIGASLVYLGVGTFLTAGVHQQIQQLEKEIIVIAHRGDATKEIQNTLPAFERAFASGAKFIEIDVQQTLDGVLVVFHDEDTTALTGQAGTITQRTWAEVSTLRVRDQVSIPSLAEVLAWGSDKPITFLLDLKYSDQETFATDIVGTIQKESDAKSVRITSLDHDLLQNIKQINPTLQTGYVIAAKSGEWTSYEADFYSINTFFIDRENIQKAHELGREVYIWELDGEADIQQALAFDVDGVIVDDFVLYDQQLAQFGSQTLTKKISERIEWWFRSIVR